MSRRDRPRTPPVGGVSFGDLAGAEPIGRAFGGDRGQPIDRHYIEGFLGRHAADIRGRAMELGDPSYLRRFGGSAVTAEIVLDAPWSDNPGATLRADLQTGDGVPPDSFDCVVITQALHLIYDVRAAIRTLHRALAPGGTVLATIPGITPIDREDGPEKWFWSMTQSAARRIFADVFGPDAVEATQYGNVLAATAFLQGLAVEDVGTERLDVVDPLFPVITGVRAVKRP